MDAQTAQHVGGGLEDARPRVKILVDAVTKTQQTDARIAILCHVHILLIVTAIVADAFQHLDDGLIRAAVQRSPQRGDTGRDRGEEIGFSAGCPVRRR